MNTNSMLNQQALALATSQIHRSRTLQELQKTFLNVAPKFVSADAYGLYLFDTNLETSSVISHQANCQFLSEYEEFRTEDPLFNFLLKQKRFTHSLAIFNENEWLREPLHDLLLRWGLNYSIEAPLICDGRVTGTLNFAIGGEKYFPKDSLLIAEFLCAEFDVTYQRLIESNKLQKQAAGSSRQFAGCNELSPRRREVLELLLDGMQNREISARLNITENTVRYHIKQLYKKYGAHNRAELLKQVYIN